MGRGLIIGLIWGVMVFGLAAFVLLLAAPSDGPPAEDAPQPRANAPAPILQASESSQAPQPPVQPRPGGTRAADPPQVMTTLPLDGPSRATAPELAGQGTVGPEIPPSPPSPGGAYTTSEAETAAAVAPLSRGSEGDAIGARASAPIEVQTEILLGAPSGPETAPETGPPDATDSATETGPEAVAALAPEVGPAEAAGAGDPTPPTPEAGLGPTGAPQPAPNLGSDPDGGTASNTGAEVLPQGPAAAAPATIAALDLPAADEIAAPTAPGPAATDTAGLPQTAALAAPDPAAPPAAATTRSAGPGPQVGVDMAAAGPAPSAIRSGLSGSPAATGPFSRPASPRFAAAAEPAIPSENALPAIGAAGAAPRVVIPLRAADMAPAPGLGPAPILPAGSAALPGPEAPLRLAGLAPAGLGPLPQEVTAAPPQPARAPVPEAVPDPASEAGAAVAAAPPAAPAAPQAPQASSRPEAAAAPPEITAEPDVAPIALPVIRLPRVGDPPGAGGAGRPPATEETPAADVPAPPPRPAIEAHAARFAADPNRPLLSIILIDDPAAPLDPAMLAELPFPVSFALDPAHPEARARAATYRAAGVELLILASMLPETGDAAEITAALTAARATMPEAVALLDTAESRIQADRIALEAVLDVIEQSGHGLVAHPRGLNTAERSAARRGIPAETLFRVLEIGPGAEDQIARLLDRAAFAAVQEGAVIVLGQNAPATMAALFAWALADRSESVAMAPASAVLQR